MALPFNWIVAADHGVADRGNGVVSEQVGTGTRVWCTGAEPRLILLHGEFGDGQLYWRDVVERLAARVDLLIPDLPGFGESLPLADLQPVTYLRWLKRLVDATTTGPAASWFLIGAGIGATIARLFAARYPSLVGRLVLSGGGALDRPSALHRLASRLVRHAALGPGRDWPRSPSELLFDPGRVCRDDLWRGFEQAKGIGARLRRAFDEAPLPAELSPVCPTLLLWGGADRYCPVAIQGAIATELRDARQVEIFEAGHLVMLDQPHRYSAHVLDFLRLAC